MLLAAVSTITGLAIIGSPEILRNATDAYGFCRSPATGSFEAEAPIPKNTSLKEKCAAIALATLVTAALIFALIKMYPFCASWLSQKSWQISLVNTPYAWVNIPINFTARFLTFELFALLLSIPALWGIGAVSAAVSTSYETVEGALQERASKNRELTLSRAGQEIELAILQPGTSSL